MSLLLEALKKAERAKQQVKTDAFEDRQPPPVPDEPAALPTELPGLEFALDPALEVQIDGSNQADEATPSPALDLDFPDLAPKEEEIPPAEEPKPSQPLQPALTLEYAETAATAPATESAKVETPPVAEHTPSDRTAASSTTPNPEPAPEPMPDKAVAIPTQTAAKPPPVAPAGATLKQHQASPEVEQQSAKNIFAAKKAKRAVPRRTVLLAVVGISAVLAGGIGYYYWQLLSAPGMAVALSPPQSLRPAPVPASPPEAATATPHLSAATTESQAATPITAEPAPHAKEPADAKEQVPTDDVAPRHPRMKESSSAGLSIVRGAQGNQVNPLLLSAYQSYMAGDAAQAEKAYRQVLQNDPRNRDALLGMATIAAGRQRASEAVAYYLQMLELDSRDAVAQAGLINLQGQADPVQSESRLKTLLTHAQETSFLHFALGNLYAQQARWGEAQREYFEAFSADPANADYAFNLAVGLDHLSQGKLAAKYYEQALSLAAGRPAAFDRQQAQERLQILSQSSPR